MPSSINIANFPVGPMTMLTGVLKGVWVAETTYNVGEVVTYNGGTYILNVAATAGTLPTDTTKWQTMNSPKEYVESLDSLTLTNTSTDNTISVDQNGNVGTDVSTDGAIHIENTGNTGIGLGVYTNIGETADAPLVHIKSANSAFDQYAIRIENYGQGTKGAIYLTQYGAGQTVGMWIDTQSTNANGAAFYASTKGCDAFTALVQTNANGNSFSATHQVATPAIFIDHDDTGAGSSIEIDRDGNNAAYIFGMKIVVDNAGVGGLVCGLDFSGMSDTEPLMKLTSTDTDLSSKSPETDAEAGWFPVLVGTTTYAVPIYALS